MVSPSVAAQSEPFVGKIHVCADHARPTPERVALVSVAAVTHCTSTKMGRTSLETATTSSHVAVRGVGELGGNVGALRAVRTLTVIVSTGLLSVAVLGRLALQILVTPPPAPPTRTPPVGSLHATDVNRDSSGTIFLRLPASAVTNRVIPIGVEGVITTSVSVETERKQQLARKKTKGVLIVML